MKNAFVEMTRAKYTPIKFSLEDISEVKAYTAGKKMFRRHYSALRHLAKMELLDELTDRVNELLKDNPLYNVRDAKKHAFEDKYGAGYSQDAREQGYSPFSNAVTKRVQEIRERK